MFEKYTSKLSDLDWLRIRLLVSAVLLVALTSFNLENDKPWVEAILVTPMIIFCAWPFFKGAYGATVTSQFNYYILIALAIIIAYVYSIWAILFPHDIPDIFKINDEIPFYFETIASIITLPLLAMMLESRAHNYTGNTVSNIMGEIPKTVHKIVEEDDTMDVPLDSIALGDILRIKPGERIPVDGVVIDGKSTADESMLTGDSLRAAKSAGSPVLAGSINQKGKLTIRAERLGQHTVLAGITEFVKNASETESPMQKFANKIASLMVPTVLIFAIFIFFLWGKFGPHPAWLNASLIFISMLVIASPTLFLLASPISSTIAIGEAQSEGILIKNKEALINFAKVNTLILDKTGILTQGKPHVQTIEVDAKESYNAEDLLKYAASLEQISKHPIAAGFLNEANKRGVKIYDAPDKKQYQVLNGKGLQGHINGHFVVVGNRRLMEENSLSVESWSKRARCLQQLGQTVIYVAIDKAVIGIVGFHDPIKASCIEAIEKLKKTELNIILLTGDDAYTAKAIAKQLRIHEVVSDIIPDDKNLYIKLLQSQGKKVAMLGDAIQDAAALSEARVGISLGKGNHELIASTDINLLKGDLMGVLKARLLCLKSYVNIQENFYFGIFYNLLALLIAAGLLYPLMGVVFNPILASFTMTLSILFVLGNSLRLLMKE